MALTRPEQKRHELIQCVIDQAEASLLQSGIAADHAAHIATKVADVLMDQFGGQIITIPIEYRRKQQEREAQIYAQFDGGNVVALAQQHGMSECGMRKLLRRAKARLTPPHDADSSIRH